MFKRIAFFFVILCSLHLWAQSDVEMVDSDDAQIEKLELSPNELEMSEAEFNKSLLMISDLKN